MQLSITSARLNAIADDRFEDVLARKIASIVRGRDDHAYLDHLAPGLQMIYATRHIENEVRRDGFEAYLSRGGGHLAAKAMQGYELVGAECHAALVENALATFLRRDTSPRALCRLGRRVQASRSATLAESRICEGPPRGVRRVIVAIPRSARNRSGVSCRRRITP